MPRVPIATDMLPRTRPKYPWHGDRSPKQIIHGIWQGGEEQLGKPWFFHKHGLSRVVSVCEKAAPTVLDGTGPYYYEPDDGDACNDHNIKAHTVEVLHVCVGDDKSADLYSHLATAVTFIHAARLLGEGVYVHCQQGGSRSATIVLAYLMTWMQCSFYQAWHFVQWERRKYSEPNIGFQQQLARFEKAVGPGSCSYLSATLHNPHAPLGTTREPALATGEATYSGPSTTAPTLKLWMGDMEFVAASQAAESRGMQGPNANAGGAARWNLEVQLPFESKPL
jgi:hypothetical protein